MTFMLRATNKTGKYPTTFRSSTYYWTTPSDLQVKFKCNTKLDNLSRLQFEKPNTVLTIAGKHKVTFSMKETPNTKQYHSPLD